ncbi:tyrosine-protein phosphatase [Nonlabens xiamenensis]|uniref:tyrosine-protein phosphatase n=1 Tax=Nonlabens xiamenensis TaxID=2341043 RepID=UPI000F608024|nr:CpsB/CapC family capsule biosynthesis tyrosine phosphatase [Nonlabens xiamenensis]
MFFFKKKYDLVELLQGFTDIHNHVLPGIDDGAAELNDTMQMIRAMKEIGIKDCIPTPHTMEDYYGNDAEVIREKYLHTLEELKSSDVSGFIAGVASEYMLDAGFEELLENKELLCLKDNYVLTELSYFQEPANLHHLVFDIQQKGLEPIMAHPERYRYVKSMETYMDWTGRGFLLQLNLLSLTDHYGKDAQRKAFALLEKDMYTFAGTDAHRLEHVDKIGCIRLDKKQFESTKKLMENHKLIFD